MNGHIQFKLQSSNGYPISCTINTPADPKMVIIAMHGFCGDQTSVCIALLEDKVRAEGIGLIKFDWPAHGVSETDGEKLTIANCLSDLDTVVSYIRDRFPKAVLVAFATSFGGYLTLLYNHIHPEIFQKIILRSPAIQMHTVMQEKMLAPTLRQALKDHQGFEYGFERKIWITEKFIEDLSSYQVDACYPKDKSLDQITIIHGTSDDLVPFSDSQDFAKKHHCKFFAVDGADHRYKNPGELEQVVEIAMLEYHDILSSCNDDDESKN